MLKVFRLTNDYYFITYNKAYFEGSLKEVIRGLLDLGVPGEDISWSLDELCVRQDHIAQYGVGLGFVVTQRNQYYKG